MRNFIPVRYGTVFLQNPGIPVFFGTVLALYFHPGIFWKLFGIFRYFFIGAISDQFRDCSQLLGLLCECLKFLGALASLDLMLSVSE